MSRIVSPTPVVAPPEGYTSHDAWLAAALPADARRFLVHDSARALARVLSAAGAEIVGEDADVEIAAGRDEIRGDSRAAVLVLQAGRDARRSNSLRALRRVLRYGVLRVRLRLARRSLAHRGYRVLTTYFWDIRQPLRTPDAQPPLIHRRLRERLTERGVVVGSRSNPGERLLGAVVRDAAAASGRPIEPVWPLVKSGGLIMISTNVVLRVAVGPSRTRILREIEVRKALTAHGPPPSVAARLPTLLAHGSTGLAHWAVEERLPGDPGLPNLRPSFVSECVDFVVDLHRLRPSGDDCDPSLSPRALASAVADVYPARGAEVLEVGEIVDAQLADVPRGFGHGDFFHSNLLQQDGRLVGVIDWDAGGARRLPLLDVLHLRVNCLRPRGSATWGPTVVSRLLPEAAAGGDATVRLYCERLGQSEYRERLTAFVAAYWLDWIAYQLTTYADRTARSAWLHRNVDLVVDALRKDLDTPARAPRSR